MNMKTLKLWLSIFSIVGVLWGVVFAFFGLGVLPPFNTDVLIPWGNGLYGAVFIGFFVTVFFTGRHAFEKQDADLMRMLLYGIFTWLAIEALFSIYYHVLLNAGVDLVLAGILGFPLIRGIRDKNRP
jgi:hypothetical protein